MLAELEEREGSLLKGLLLRELKERSGDPKHIHLIDVYRWLRREGEARAASPFLSFKGGMQTLVDALRRTLPDDGVRLRANVSSVRAVDGGGFVIELERESIFADAVVLAAPAHATAAMVADAELGAELGGIRYESTATIFFALDKDTVAHSLEGFGFIVPPGEGALLAGTWVSSKWANRAPEGAALVRAFVGGARDPERVSASTDKELAALAKTELERLMGPLGRPRFVRVYRYRQASPQPAVGHVARVERIRARASLTPGLHVAGAAFDGVGIPDCVRQARDVASKVTAELTKLAEHRAAGG
jgi:oxygen-dependent protoporphyrinogen oxidase